MAQERHWPLAGRLQVTDTLMASGVMFSELPDAPHAVLGVHMTVTSARWPEDKRGALMLVTPTRRGGACQPPSGLGVDRGTTLSLPGRCPGVMGFPRGGVVWVGRGVGDCVGAGSGAGVGLGARAVGLGEGVSETPPVGFEMGSS